MALTRKPMNYTLKNISKIIPKSDFKTIIEKAYEHMGRNFEATARYLGISQASLSKHFVEAEIKRNGPRGRKTGAYGAYGKVRYNKLQNEFDELKSRLEALEK